MNIIQNISIIGSGNVATHLAKSFYNAGIKIDNIYSRNFENAKILAKIVDSIAVNKIELITPHSDLYIFSVTDGVIKLLSEKLNKSIGYNIKVVHTSGMVSSMIFKNLFKEYGVLYPLQTFTKEREVDMTKVPFCLTANSKQFEKELVNLARNISDNVKIIGDEERMKLHVAAVFVNNFTNFLYSIGKEITEQENIDFELLLPLIQETGAKILDG
ncbi:MAG TPA: DUF2520 domain-containing protein, partial [Bacteroidetes bacterium]|nr:DUF2520 domain-containing protein [Bacteroidota bacterium]